MAGVTARFYALRPSPLDALNSSGRRSRSILHPLVVFLGLVLWSWVWGVWGTILAVPMLVG
jgi:hypothetical protein